MLKNIFFEARHKANHRGNISRAFPLKLSNGLNFNSKHFSWQSEAVVVSAVDDDAAGFNA